MILLMVNRFVAALILLAFAGTVGAQDTLPASGRILLSGYVKSLQTLYFQRDLDPLTTLNELHQRLSIEWTLTPSLRLRAGMRNRVLWGDQLRVVPDRDAALNGGEDGLDLSILWVDKPAFVVHTVFDRLALHLTQPRWEVRAGRQRINWGLHPVWNPNDIFNAYSLLDFDYEERPGTDALRIQYFPSGLSAIEIAYAFGSGGRHPTYAACFRFNTGGYDMQAFAGRAGPDLVAGGGWAGSLGDTGFKGEVTCFHPAGKEPDSLASISVALGVDRTFSGDWYTSAGWLYQSNAFPSGRIQDWTNGTNLSAKTLMPFEISWFASLTRSLSPITQVNFAFIYSPKNTSLILLPSFRRNLMDNLDFDVFLQSFFADTDGAYQSAGQAFFLRFRWSY